MSGQGLSQKKYFTLSDEQKINWLRLIRSQNVGPATFIDLIFHYGTASAALEALPELARRGGAAARIKIFPREDAEQEFERAERVGARYIALGESEYPPLLRSAEHSPPLICIRGSTELLVKPAIAVVGSRNASIAGMKLSQRFASELGEAGYAIVSGLARGIDTAAHKASVRNGTIAVFAGGVDHIFPEENAGLASQIIDHGGTIVSEMPMGWQPRAKDFPRRNRIISGLSLASVIIEAAKRSGSLITARLANEMGRLVLAVPGSPLDPRSEGTNDLIKQGATLVTTSADIQEAIAPLDESVTQYTFDLSEQDDPLPLEIEKSVSETNDEVRQRIIGALSPSPTDIDDIVRFTSTNISQVQLILVELSLAGRIERHTGNRVSLI